LLFEHSLHLKISKSLTLQTKTLSSVLMTWINYTEQKNDKQPALSNSDF
jgi:hypothetical protein